MFAGPARVLPYLLLGVPSFLLLPERHHWDRRLADLAGRCQSHAHVTKELLAWSADWGSRHYLSGRHHIRVPCIHTGVAVIACGLTACHASPQELQLRDLVDLGHVPLVEYFSCQWARASHVHIVYIGIDWHGHLRCNRRVTFCMSVAFHCTLGAHMLRRVQPWSMVPCGIASVGVFVRVSCEHFMFVWGGVATML